MGRPGSSASRPRHRLIELPAAREALEALVREERPELACVTLLEDGVKVGVWDWVERQPYWTPL